ncbi:E3 ubiquitin-protein ligase UPL3-like isoform X1 [Dendrobium catenatum]|uniref:E3 ubiquitin-protein ligase UPL3-like isoform X1 n=1 Tax=Dendrobium catenatum TaxID=906689 RepID=UPI0009F3690D|nr:E3 ubiquitin-protein ligase UPL3-like isoform X1 [Dendrobium catenatum]XP_020699968.1 E3 ubiquitin-protein ligase UPL3-like isoform X1 [Dendrobium catenatum]XP_020699969.1 E3 ubiquitin-protein ligase UPL3-like isoform X1 [Dendrobium catenatum]
METRSRKRAEASSFNPPATRASKRPRSSSAASSNNPVASRTRQAATSAAASAMDSDYASGGSRRERRSFGRNSGRDRDPPSDKGKEREPPEGSSRLREREREREIDREAERILGISFDSGGADDDNDSEGGVGILHHNFSSASSALQGLLRKLGAGLDDLLPSSALSGSSSHQSSRLKKILSGLRADGEEGRQVEALTQLCELLSIGTEDSLGSFSVDSFVPVLVGLLNHESNPDVMLLAARALTHLCDVLPSSCAAVVHYGAVPCFCARLLTIEYMDLAEQSLQALKKISQEHPTACLRAGALMAVLSYLDFFSTGVQRVALCTAANMCKKLPSDASDFVMEAIPLLTNLLHYHDAKVLEYASVCLTRIAEAFASSPDKLDELCHLGLVAQAAGLISLSNSGGQASLSSSTYTGLIRLLSTCVSGSPLAARTLLLLGISGTLKDILSGSGLVANVSVHPALARPPEQIYEIVNLADELLPPLPQGTVSLPIYSNVFAKGSAGKKISGSSSGKQETNGTSNEISSHEKLLRDQSELLQQFGMDLLPVLTQIYGSSVNGPIRHRCLSVIGKLMYFSSAEMIPSLLSATNISSFLAGVLAWKDPQVLIPALQIAEILMDKLPDIFAEKFVREGVVHAIDALIVSDSSTSVPSQSSLLEKKDAESISSRSRRHRRRNGGLNTDGGLFDEAKVLADGATGSPPSSQAPAANNSIRATVSNLAKAFKDKHFPAVPGSTEVGVTEDLLLLRSLCSKLNASAVDVKTRAKGKSKACGASLFDSSTNMEGDLDGVISEMLTELCKGNGVSTFEFIGSGVVIALLNYFSCGTFGKDRLSEANLSTLRQQVLLRYKSFLKLALPVGVKEGNEVPMSILVQKLQNALSALERFPVVLSHPSRSSGGGSARLSSGLSALSQPFKLRLYRAQGEKSLRDYSSNVVLIDPLATLAAVEEFLWPRVQRSDSAQKISSSAGNPDAATATGGSAASPGTSTPASSHRPTTRSRSSLTIGGSVGKESCDRNASFSKGKGKAVLKSTPDEKKGAQGRNTARRTSASEKDREMKPSHGDSNSEDDNLDVSLVEIDDALMIEEDDVSDDEDDYHDEVLREESLPVCAPDKVHDVKLGDPADDSALPSSTSSGHTRPSASSNKTVQARGSESTELRSGSAFSSRGAMSFAAAAMAGLASVSGRGIRGGRGRRGLPNGNENNGKLVFSVGGKQLNKNMTIYQAIQRQLVLDEDDGDRLNGSELMPTDGSRFWSDIFTITYQTADNQADGSALGSSSSAKSLKSSPASSSGSDSRRQQLSLPDSILQGELPCDIEKSNPTYHILALLRVLDGLNQLASRLRAQAVVDDYSNGKVTNLDGLYVAGVKVPPEEFINSKLTPKLVRQIQDALALCSGSLPSWCYQLTKACPFLFPFETRRHFFYTTAFGLSRALHHLQQQQNAENTSAMSEREVRVGRLQRQKVRVSRNRILESAAKVMEMYSGQKAVLEVEYFGEVGTGLGPTLEFYTLLSHDLQKVGLGLWRSNTSSEMQNDGEEVSIDDSSDGKKMAAEFSAQSDFVIAPLGLFPRPWPLNADASEGSQFSKVVEHFRLAGRVMAKALQDGRLLDLSLSTAFYKLVLGQDLDLYDIVSFDSEFGKILQELQILVSKKRLIKSVSEGNQRGASDLHFRGTPIEDLCLDFTLPGYPDYILKEGKESMVVNIDNLEEYISLILDATVKTGIMRQMEAFRAGFNQVFDISFLQIFSPHELDYLICGRRELWEADTLADHIKFDHGYTAKSPAIINLLEIMAEFTPEQQHAFCQFVTGAPRLPPGGLAALNPKLTIVRKHSSTATNTASNGSVISEAADDDLPSVMTCANFLKLPPYSTKEIMYKKLLYAINEGQGSFDLS